MPIINTKALREARTRKGWTQRDLSEATKPQINVSTISRLERGKPSRIRDTTLKELARALEVSKESLCAAKEPERDMVKFSLDTATRNALALVALRYGVHRERIIELAPLMFYIMAEQSLRARQRRVNDLNAAADTVFATLERIRHLPRHWPIDETAVSSEELSISKRDLFAALVTEKSPQFLGEYAQDYEDAKCNPFTDQLREALSEIGAPSEEIDRMWCDDDMGASYRICAEQAALVVGDDARAIEAVLSGFAALHEMPKNAPMEKRTAWALAEMDRAEQSIKELMEEFGLDAGKETTP